MLGRRGSDYILSKFRVGGESPFKQALMSFHQKVDVEGTYKKKKSKRHFMLLNNYKPKESTSVGEDSTAEGQAGEFLEEKEFQHEKRQNH